MTNFGTTNQPILLDFTATRPTIWHSSTPHVCNTLCWIFVSLAVTWVLRMTKEIAFHSVFIPISKRSNNLGIVLPLPSPSHPPRWCSGVWWPPPTPTARARQVLCSSSLSHPSSPEPQIPSGSCDFSARNHLLVFLVLLSICSSMMWKSIYSSIPTLPHILRSLEQLISWFFFGSKSCFFASKLQITKIHYSEF